jgi:protocatechuate 3,4-dioxygenase beta subunit
VTPNWQDVDEEDRGLLYDLPALVSRRRALGLLGGLGAAGVLAACTSSGRSEAGTGSSATRPTTTTTTPTTTTPSTSAGSSSAATSGDVGEVPDETSGPYPGDGSNGPDALTESGIVRRDITRSFGASTTKAEGVPLTIRLTVRDAATGDVKKGAAVYLWHCDRAGGYSMYAADLTNENYLRGVQPTDASGTATFTSIFPAAYSGRWPHIHFEVYESVANATANGQIVKTSQIALPRETCQLVYATTGYEQSVTNLAQTSLTSDMVFGDDGGIHQLASMSGDVAKGYAAALTIGV